MLLNMENIWLKLLLQAPEACIHAYPHNSIHSLQPVCNSLSCGPCQQLCAVALALQAKAELARHQHQLGAEKHIVSMLKTQLADAQVGASARLHAGSAHDSQYIA